MKRRKYPLILFVMGIIIELFRKWFILIPLMVLLFFPAVITITIPILLLIALVSFAVTKTLKYRKTILNAEPNKEASDMLDEIFADNNKGYKNIIEVVDELIDKRKNNTAP